ncbi:hypothetical protein Tco_0901434 [Tanacetum coccineum]
MVPGKGDLRDYWSISTDGDFLGPPPSYTLIRDPVLRGLDVGSVNIPYLLARYLRRFAAGRKSGALISRGQFIARLAEHFRLLIEERLQGLTVIIRELLVIDMAELVRLQIYMEIDHMGLGVALMTERHLKQRHGAHLRPLRSLRIAIGCQDFTGTYGEINDRSEEILHMDDFMYDTAHGG